MDRLCCVLRSRLWLYLLLCVLQVTAAHAATRKYVSMPSDSDVVGSGRGSSVSGDLLNIPGNPIEGEYIPSSYGGGSKGTKLPVQPQYQYVKSRTINGMVGKLKGGNLAGIGLTIGLQYMLDQVGGFIDENGQPVKRIPDDGSNYAPGPTDLRWSMAKPHSSTPTQPVAGSASAVCTIYGKAFAAGYTGVTYVGSSITGETATQATCNYQFNQNGTVKSGTAVATRTGETCPSGYDRTGNNCVKSSTGTTPLTQADYDLMAAAAAAKDSEWLKERLKEHCQGSIAPEKCYESLRDSVRLTGPASVQGPTQTTTGTYTKPDGTTGTTSSTSTTNYNIKYGDNYYDYSKSVTTTKTQDGQKVSEETTTESEEPVEEEKPQDDPSPCVANCDGPAYSDKYTPTTQTKENVIDDYLSRVKAAPILSAGSNFLTVSVGASCPVWEVHHNMQILGATMPIDLVFDFHCLPWFVDFQPWAALVFAIVCAFGAFYIAILD